MNLSSLENFQPEPKPNNEQKADDISVSPSIANAMLAVRACGVCGLSNSRPALNYNQVEVWHCCLSFIGNLSKCNGNTLWEELENQTKYINNANN